MKFKALLLSSVSLNAVARTGAGCQLSEAEEKDDTVIVSKQLAKRLSLR